MYDLELQGWVFDRCAPVLRPSGSSTPLWAVRCEGNFPKSWGLVIWSVGLVDGQPSNLVPGQCRDGCFVVKKPLSLLVSAACWHALHTRCQCGVYPNCKSVCVRTDMTLRGHKIYRTRKRDIGKIPILGNTICHDLLHLSISINLMLRNT